MIAVTGATGFVGGALCREAARRGRVVRAITRRTATVAGADEVAIVGDLAHTDMLDEALGGAETVIHCAARVHMMAANAQRDEEAFRRSNVDATTALATAALAAGAKRFVYLSTIKVLGEATTDHGFRHDDPFAPVDAYSRSKADAERELRRLAALSGLEVVIVRPPLVHGPGVRGNLGALARLLRRGIPLPLGAIRNRRAVLGVDNLVDALLLATTHPAAPGATFHLRDAEVPSTPELVRGLAAGLGVRARLLDVPPAWLRVAARLTGRGAMAQRMIDSLDVDMEHTMTALGWRPPVALADGLRRAMAPGAA